MTYVNHQLFPTSPDPVVPSIAVRGELRADRPGIISQAVNRAAVFLVGLRRTIPVWAS